MRLAILHVTLAMLAAPPAVAQDPAPDAARAEARSHIASQQWGEARALLEPIARGPQANARDWYGLGLAFHGLAQHDEALSAFEAAEAAGFGAVGLLHLQRARSLMAKGDRDAALSSLEALGEAGGANFRAVEQTAEFADLAGDARFASVIDALRPCRASVYRQFDFWLGEWDVIPAANPAQTYRNVITLAEDGCMIMEDYAAGLFTGTSINFYDSNTGKWHQSWMSNTGSAAHLQGGLNEAGEMVLTSEGLPVAEATGTIARVTWTPNDDGSVRQFWQQSQDGGATWTTAFDGLYRRREGE